MALNTVRPTRVRAVEGSSASGSAEPQLAIPDADVTTYDSAAPGVLTELLGQPIEGTWTLAVVDQVRRDVGTLRSWRLDLTT